MNSRVEGAKYFVLSGNGLHWRNAFFEGSSACRDSKFVPYWSVFRPRCWAYHALTALGSLHLKKIPPTPVTRLGVGAEVGAVVGASFSTAQPVSAARIRILQMLITLCMILFPVERIWLPLNREATPGRPFRQKTFSGSCFDVARGPPRGRSQFGRLGAMLREAFS